MNLKVAKGTLSKNQMERGVYEALSAIGYATPAQLADTLGISRSFTQYWLQVQAVQNALDYEPVTGTYSIWCCWPPLDHRAYELEV